MYIYIYVYIYIYIFLFCMLRRAESSPRNTSKNFVGCDLRMLKSTKAETVCFLKNHTQ